jgi:hypothetical protein
MTAKNVTWLGEDQGTSPGPSFNIWGQAISGTMTCYFKFDKGVPLLIDDEAGTPQQRQLAQHILAQAASNRFFTVEGSTGDPPILTSLSPDTAASGDADFVLHCMGSNFTPASVIQFGPAEDNDEPTTFVSSTEVTTGVKPSLFDPAVVPVTVRNGEASSNEVEFTFTEPLSDDEAPRAHRTTAHHAAVKRKK